MIGTSGARARSSAKIVRRAVRAAISGEDPGDLSSLENPGALNEIRDAVT
jgi:acetyl-CoA synthetase